MSDQVTLPKNIIIISQFDNGTINVHTQGEPLENRLLWYGMLGMAHDIIKDNADRSKIHRPRPDELKHLNGHGS